MALDRRRGRVRRGGGARYLRKSAQRETGFFKSLGGLLTALAGRTVRFCALGLLAGLALAVLSGLFIGGYLYLSKSDYFLIKRISITGLNQISREEVLEAAGLTEAVNLLTYDLEEARLGMETLPWVAEARISRVMPDSIEIALVEYEARFVANLGRLYYMDERGLPFKMLEPGENPELVIVSGFSEDDLLNRSPVTVAGVSEVLWLMGVLAERNDEFRLDNVSEINYDRDRGLTVYTRNTGIQIKAGFGAYAEKFHRLGRVMAHLKREGLNEGLNYLNLESGPRVTVRYHEDASAARQIS